MVRDPLWCMYSFTSKTPVTRYVNLRSKHYSNIEKSDNVETRPKPGPNFQAGNAPRPSQRQVEVVIPMRKKVTFVEEPELAQPSVTPNEATTLSKGIDQEEQELNKIIEEALKAPEPVAASTDPLEQQKQRTYQRISKIRSMLNENTERRSL